MKYKCKHFDLNTNTNVEYWNTDCNCVQASRPPAPRHHALLRGQEGDHHHHDDHHLDDHDNLDHLGGLDDCDDFDDLDDF